LKSISALAALLPFGAPLPAAAGGGAGSTLILLAVEPAGHGACE
jgi:hypothetical protein